MIYIRGKTGKGKSTWIGIAWVPGGGVDNNNRYLHLESPDAFCYQRLRPETHELLVRFLYALEEDQKHSVETQGE